MDALRSGGGTGLVRKTRSRIDSEDINGMNKLNVAEIPLEKTISPKGRYRQVTQKISDALTRMNGLGHAGATQPFAIELVRVPAGAVDWPFHSHSAQWEFYLITAGRGQVRTPDGIFHVREGDCMMHPPGEPHQISNTGATDLVYYSVADNSPSDVCHFPDTNQWLLPGQAGPARLLPSKLYAGEE